MGGADRLSSLSNDLLAAVISLLPTREAVRTAALSRRWRSVWFRAHSLILDSRSYGDCSEDIWAYFGRQDDGTQDRLFSNACDILDAAGRCSHAGNLSLTVHGRNKGYFEDVMGWSCRDSYDLMASILGASALRHLEEVRVKFEVVHSPRHCGRDKKLYDWVYKLDPAQLPEHTLRVLDLDNCRLQSPLAVSFPRLSSLRLCKCSSSAKDLEGWIRTAPSLGTVHIEDHDFLYHRSDDDTRRFALHSPSLTALTIVLRPCLSTREHFEVVETPRLHTFKYKGSFNALSMRSQTPNLERVDLTIRRFYDETGYPAKTWFAPFWQLLRNFRHVKAIKLKVPNIEGIAVVDKDVRHEHLFTLPVLERLELRGFLNPAGRTDDAALAVANLLQCCPVLHDLLIRIPTDPYQALYEIETSTQVRVSDFDVSMDVFRRRRFSKEMVVPLMVDPDDDDSSQVGVLPGLTGCRFRCLDNHLKNVTLQFELKELNSFEVCLAKFFAENCMFLETLQIDDGKHNFLRHVNWMVERWRANAPKQRKQTECDSADSSKQAGKRKRRNYRVYNAE
ncbi:hypothetical protein ACQ4PT_045627 [Festuca glaucescens]